MGLGKKERKSLITRVVNVSEQSGEKRMEIYTEMGQLIRDGGLVAFPTETVYGLGANAMDETASARIYEAKGRPSDNPLIAHIADRCQLDMLTETVSEKAKRLMDAFWPGPLTLIFQKTTQVPYGTTGGLDTVAVRMPNHPVALALIRAAKVPIAAPSANLSGRPSPVQADHVYTDLAGRIDVILDGGETDIGIESTIVDVTGECPMILRPGYITRQMLEEVVGEVALDPFLLTKAEGNVRPKAPGMAYRHYAPKAPLAVVQGEQQAVVDIITQLVQKDIASGKKVGIICTDETRMQYHEGEIKSIGTRMKEESIAHNLYRILREFDEVEVSQIYSESFGGTGLGNSIMNRLLKAAGHEVIDATCKK